MRRWRIVADTWRKAGTPVERLAVDIAGERIVDVLPAKDLPSAFETITFPSSALLIPGFCDSHTHLLTGALSLNWVSLAGVRDVDEAAARLKTAAHQSDGEWVDGHGFEESELSLDRWVLDRIVPDIPVFIRSHDLHSAVVNSRTLARVGITEQTADPPRGRFDRGADGRLNGFVREHACDLLLGFRPLLTKKRAHQALLQAQSLAFSLGITAVGVSARQDLIPFYLDFAQSTEAKLRLDLWKVTADFDFQADRFTPHREARFRFATFKGFVDGALGSQTAAFWEPYANDPENRGILVASEQELSRFIREATDDGFQLALHAIGDRACTVALNALETAGARGQRMRLEHAQTMRQDDIDRLHNLGVVVSMQPIHATADMRWVEERLGKERASLSYAWRSIRDADVPLCFGSDWPIESMNPLAGIHAAVTREDEQGNPPGGWIPEQCLTVEEALEAYTQAGAYASWCEQDSGSILEGKSADLAVLSCNPFSCDPRDILSARVLMTVCGGEIVYRSDT